MGRREAKELLDERDDRVASQTKVSHLSRQGSSIVRLSRCWVAHPFGDLEGNVLPILTDVCWGPAAGVKKMDIFTLIFFATISLNFLLTLFFLNSPPSKPLELSLFTWHDTWKLYHQNGRAFCSLASSIIREVDGRTPWVILPAMPSVAAGQPVVDRLPTTWGLP